MPLRGIAGRSITGAGSPVDVGDLVLVDGDFVLIFIPDSQTLVEDIPEYFAAQTAWIAHNRNLLNIQAVLHVGDVVEVNNDYRQWGDARTAWDALSAVHMPFLVVPGNHDYNSIYASRTLSRYNEHFGTDIYTDEDWWNGEFYTPGASENLYFTRTIGGTDYLFIGLEFGPRDEMLTWAGGLCDTYSDHLVILLTHSYMHSDETRTGPGDVNNPKSYSGITADANDGEDMWTKLVKLKENIALVWSGHQLVDGVGRRTDLGDNGNIVNQILANYQLTHNGMLRIAQFRPVTRSIFVYTYSPALDSYLTDNQNQFELSY